MKINFSLNRIFFIRFFQLVVILVTLFIPDVVFGQENLVACTGLECQFCHLISTGQNAMNWLVLILAVVAGLLFAYAGLILVVSGGNSSARERSLAVFRNVVIGYILVLIAWLLVDTSLKMIANQSLLGQGGAFGPWNQIPCVGQSTPALRALGIPVEDFGSWLVDSDGQVLHAVTGVEAIEGAIADSAAMQQGEELEWAEGEACDESQMVQVGAFGSTVTVHQSVASSLQSASAEWESRGGNSYYEVRSIACYNCRNVAGTGRRSAHAYGIACDINPAENPYGSTLVTDMEPDFVQIFTSRGWGWGGNWRSVKDAMHFSKARHEGGDGMDIR